MIIFDFVSAFFSASGLEGLGGVGDIYSLVRKSFALVFVFVAVFRMHFESFLIDQR